MDNPAESIRVRRRMPAPRWVVFEAWTTPEGFRHWMAYQEQVSGLLLRARVGTTVRRFRRSRGSRVVHALCLESGNFLLDQYVSVQVLAIFDGDEVFVDLAHEDDRLLRLDALAAMQVSFRRSSRVF